MKNIDPVASQRLFTVKKNQLKLVERRGYKVEKDEKNILKIPLESFLDAYVPFAEKKKKSLRAVLSRPYESETGDGRIYVYFADHSKSSKQLGIDVVSDAISSADKYKTRNLVLITPVALTSSASKKIEELVSYNISIFLESEMVYDPTEHYFTPEHRALSENEARSFLKNNDLSVDQLPIILNTDMISRYYGFRPGQIIEIKRVNMFDALVQNSLSYRVVKEDR